MRRIVALAGLLASIFLATWLVCTALGLFAPDSMRDWLLSLDRVGAAAAGMAGGPSTGSSVQLRWRGGCAIERA